MLHRSIALSMFNTVCVYFYIVLKTVMLMAKDMTKLDVPQFNFLLDQIREPIFFFVQKNLTEQ